MNNAHKTAPFFYGPEGLQGTFSYVCLRLRQMAGKIRGLCGDATAWDALVRKLGQQDLRVILRLCRCLKPSFNPEAGASPLEEKGTPSSFKDHPEPWPVMPRLDMELDIVPAQNFAACSRF